MSYTFDDIARTFTNATRSVSSGRERFLLVPIAELDSPPSKLAEMRTQPRTREALAKPGGVREIVLVVGLWVVKGSGVSNNDCPLTLVGVRMTDKRKNIITTFQQGKARSAPRNGIYYFHEFQQPRPFTTAAAREKHWPEIIRRKRFELLNLYFPPLLQKTERKYSDVSGGTDKPITSAPDHQSKPTETCAIDKTEDFKLSLVKKCLKDDEKMPRNGGGLETEAEIMSSECSKWFKKYESNTAKAKEGLQAFYPLEAEIGILKNQVADLEKHISALEETKTAKMIEADGYEMLAWQAKEKFEEALKMESATKLKQAIAEKEAEIERYKQEAAVALKRNLKMLSKV